MITALVGAQFGSEGKGLIAGHIAKDFDTHVRVGAANAGHTLYTRTLRDATQEQVDAGEGGLRLNREKHVMQQLPCAAYANPDATLVIGPGALISPEIFLDEVDQLRAWRGELGLGLADILVDWRAHVIQDEQIAEEAATDLEKRIGSTSATAREGIGIAQADRVMRHARCARFIDWWEYAASVYPDVRQVDVPARLAQDDRWVLLEGTQGTGLSLTTGEFPYVTSRNTTAAGLAADVGVGPSSVEQTILVARTYPIRVAGNSGPFYAGSCEIGWEDIGVDPDSERTTVTKKIRRVATFSLEQIIEAVRLNSATEIALTFCDYVDSRIAGQSSAAQGTWTSLSAYPDVEQMADAIEDATGIPVAYLGTGPASVIELDRS